MMTSTPTVAAPVFVKYGYMTHNKNIHILFFYIVNEITSNQAVGIQGLKYKDRYTIIRSTNFISKKKVQENN